MRLSVLLVALTVPVRCAATPRNVTAGALLNSVATMISHDAATGYIGNLPVLCAYYQTQTVGFVEQADCGTRAFDLRMKKVDDVWRYYHPSQGWDDYVLMDQGIPDTMSSFVAWAAVHPDEMLVLYFSHIAGGDPAELMGELAQTGVRVADGCNTSFTYADAMAYSAIDQATGGGGHVLVFMNCNQDNFGVFENVAWNDWQAMDDATLTMMLDPSYRSGFWQAQTIWQLGATAKKTTIGVLGYGTLKNNAESKTNERTATVWGPRGIKVGGLWLADNICDGGISLARSLGTVVSDEDAASCASSCDNAHHKCNQDYECATYMNTNGCCLCKGDGSGCDKHMWLGHSTYGQKCDDCPQGADCGPCPEYGFKC